MTPAVLLWTHREEESWVLCGAQGEPLGAPQQVPLSMFLVRNTNNLLDLQEGDKKL